MKYLKPKCECGEDLLIIEERTHEIKFNIKANGNISDKEKIHREDVGVSGASWLECKLCMSEYEIDYDGKDRVIRGDKR